MLADANLAVIGQALAEEHRARFLLALLGGEELSAGALAGRSGASSSLASAHLATLREAGLVEVTRRGRKRIYRLAGPEVARALEAILVISPIREAGNLRDSSRGTAIRRARTCYDHLAGELGVEVTEALERQNVIQISDSGWDLTDAGERQIKDLGIDVARLHRRRRPLTRSCLDWTERRPHLAGSLGSAITERFFELGWIKRLPDSRAVSVTPAGASELRARFALSF